MIVRTLSEIIGGSRHVSGDGWESRRLLLKDDAMGFSLHDTIVKQGTEQRLHYKNHLEANYCISGEGETDSACPSIKGPNITTLAIGDGHHFGGDYQRLVNVILARR